MVKVSEWLAMVKADARDKKDYSLLLKNSYVLKRTKTHKRILLTTMT